MKRLVVGVVCILACCLSVGCARTDSSPTDPGNKVLNYLHLHSDKTEPAPHEAEQVCILDPSALAEDETASQAPPTGEKTPVVEVPETSYDFGKITEESDFVHKFSVRNTGKSVLTIKKVLPG